MADSSASGSGGAAPVAPAPPAPAAADAGAAPDVSILTALASSARVPSNSNQVYKDECMFSFTTPESEGGLYMNLQSFQSFSEEFVALDRERTGQRLYLHSTWKRVEKKPTEEETAAAAASDAADPAADGTAVAAAIAASTAAPAAATGAGGGAGAEKPAEPKSTADAINEITVVDYDKSYKLVVLPEKVEFAYPADNIPAPIAASVEAIIKRADATTEAAAKKYTKEKLRVSKYAKGLPQLAAKQIPSSGWKCEESGETENLWLNLSTGHIGSGRPNWAGTGGTGAALKHYHDTGDKYPLVVKLGTITAKGADVFSYAADEDDMVEDPYLAEHLAHWGINMMKMTKTAKTMDEMEYEGNMKFEWNLITEEGAKLKPVQGPGLVGLRNIGNSCYFNSVIQTLFSLPEFGERYLPADGSVFMAAPANPGKDFNTQMHKLAVGLLTNKYVKSDAELAALKDEKDEEKTKELAFVVPRMLKTLVGAGHIDFSTGQQQDAADYLLHFLDKINLAERTGTGATTDLSLKFQFKVEGRLECGQSQQVQYSESDERMWSLSIPMDAATNKAEYDADQEMRAKATAAKTKVETPPVLLQVPWKAVLDNWSDDSLITDWLSPATNAKGTAKKRTRFKTFPKFLVVQMRKYVQDFETWQVNKLNCSVPLPEKLDLEAFRAKGLQAGETELPSGAAAAAAETVEPDAAIVAQLTAFGFSENACKRAAIAVSNANAEVAAAWLMDHSGDADINDPPGGGAGSGAGGASGADPTMVASLVAMLGISEAHATRALEETGGAMDRAADWALSHEEAAAAPADAPANDGPGKYNLVGIISHLGSNTNMGHYVCHVKKKGVWYIFNDAKVAESASVPFDKGYVYVYARES